MAKELRTAMKHFGTTTEPQVRAVSMHVSVSSVGGTNIGKNNTRVSCTTRSRIVPVD